MDGDNCVNCKGGYYGDGGESDCKKCPPGTDSVTERNSYCLPCPEGTFKEISGKGRCKICPVGPAATNEQAL